MRSRSIWTRIAVVAVAVAAMAAVVALPAGAQDSESSETQVLKVGWAQDVKTLNPFVGVNEENFTVWALTWDLLVNFSPEDLSPTAGIAEEWEVSDDRRTVTFTLDPDAKWSDGEPITSADVKYSLETLGGEGFLFTTYTDRITSIETPDDETVVIETEVPDARIVGGLFIYMLPEHVWGEVPIDDLTGSYEPELPMVGSGPYVVTEFDRERILRMETNPNFRGDEPEYDEIQFIKYGNQDAVERAMQLGEVDMVLEVQASTFERLGTEPNIETLQSPSPGYTQLTFNLCPEELCPDGQRNPAVLDQDVRQAIAYSLDRERINDIATRGTSFVAHGILPTWYQDFYEQPAEDYAFDLELANQILDDAGWEDTGDGPRTKDGEELSFDLYARSESPYTVQMARLVSEMAAEVGVEFNVQVVSTDKLTELTVQKTDGKPAPDFDSFIWGWGGDPYDPSFLLGILTTDEIGGSSDSFYSNPDYDRLFEEQAEIFDVEERKGVIQEMVAMTQDDLPYLVLTEDPNLQAYRTDRVGGVEPVCPAETGDIFCDTVSYEPLVSSIGPVEGASDDDGGGAGTGLLIAAAAVVVAGLAYLVVRSRRGRRGGEPLEFEE